LSDNEQFFTIDVTDQQSAMKVDADELRRAVAMIVDDADIRLGRIGIAVVDDPTIHRINREFLDHDWPTDVISFVLEETPGYLEGEIIMSTDTAIDRSSDYGWSPADELLLYVVHGTLHLVGYDDHEDDDRQAMREKERHYMSQFGRTARYDDQ